MLSTVNQADVCFCCVLLSNLVIIGINTVCNAETSAQTRMSHGYESHPSSRTDDRADLSPSKSPLSSLILPPASDPSLLFRCKNRSHIVSLDGPAGLHPHRGNLPLLLLLPRPSEVPPERHPLLHSPRRGSAYRLCSWKHLRSHFTLS